MYKRLVCYLRHTIPGKYLIERAIWIIAHLVAIAVFSYMIYDTTRAYRHTPTATHMVTDMFPINQVDFPAVAICNSNLISKKRAEKYAEELWQRKAVKSMNLTKSRILELVKYIGHLYTFSIQEEKSGDLALFHQILQTGYEGTHKYDDVERVTKKVAVQCEKYVIRCQWKGAVRTCADILQPRSTPHGSCCTFNYARWKDHFTRDTSTSNKFAAPIERSEAPGAEYGLWLLLDAEEDDYFYQLLPFVGFKVMIYTPTDYPDSTSGGAKEILVGRGTETLLNLGASIFNTTDQVRHVHQDRRKCFFKSELQEKFGGLYSFSDCIMICRVHDIIEKCMCIPFFYPIPNGIDFVRQCTLDDLKCLNRFENRWWGMNPIIEDREAPFPPGVFSEVAEGHLQCQCYPSCTNIDYTVFKAATKILNNVIVWDTDEHVINRTDDHTVLNIYFGRSSVMKLQHDVQYCWYELMSNYGGLCNIFLGLSLISGIEMVYTFFQSLFGRGKKMKNISRKVAPAKKILVLSKDEIILKQQTSNYWQEINVRNFSNE